MRNLTPVVLLVMMLALNPSASPVVAKSSIVPESGLLVLLGGGLVGLAALIRRHFSD